MNLGDLAAGEHTAATVAVYGGGVAVEQTVVGRTGVSTSPCADRASSTWYLADGTTTADASFTLVLYNPFPDDAVVDIALTTVERTLEPPNLQGAVVPGQSVRLSTSAPRRSARRSSPPPSEAAGPGSWSGASSRRTTRPATASPPASAAAQAQQTWWFPDGDKGDGIGERFVVFNPGDLDASVELSFLPGWWRGGAPAGEHRGGAVELLGRRRQRRWPTYRQGPHSTLVNVVGDQTPVVVERLLTRPVDEHARHDRAARVRRSPCRSGT